MEIKKLFAGPPRSSGGNLSSIKYHVEYPWGALQVSREAHEAYGLTPLVEGVGDGPCRLYGDEVARVTILSPGEIKKDVTNIKKYKYGKAAKVFDVKLLICDDGQESDDLNLYDGVSLFAGHVVTKNRVDLRLGIDHDGQTINTILLAAAEKECIHFDETDKNEVDDQNQRISELIQSTLADGVYESSFFAIRKMILSKTAHKVGRMVTAQSVLATTVTSAIVSGSKLITGEVPEIVVASSCAAGFATGLIGGAVTLIDWINVDQKESVRLAEAEETANTIRNDIEKTFSGDAFNEQWSEAL